MNLDQLIKKYSAHPLFGELVKNHNTTEVQHVHLDGLRGSSIALLIAALYKHEKFNAVFVLNDREEAAYFANDLENLLGTTHVMFFPASYKKTGDPTSLDNSNVLQRAEVLNRISKNPAGNLIITHTESFYEKVTTKHSLHQNTFDVKRGSVMSQDFLSEFLDDNDFVQTDFVYEAGQYAMRGGIMDVYSFAFELPFRIEFFDDRIESIRTFDPSNQLSVQQMDVISIIPNIQTKLLKQTKEHFLNFIGNNYRIWMRDYDSACESISALHNKMSELIITVEEAETPPIENFSGVKEMQELMQQFKIVEFGNRASFDDAAKLHFNVHAQPSFNKNFNLLFQTIHENQTKHIESLIIADQPKQIERIYAIFDDIGKTFLAKGQNINFTTLLLSLHEGFVDNDLKLACYTDHQIFDRYHRFRMKKNFAKGDSISLKDLYALRPGDYITHIDHGVGRFGGLETIEANGKTQEAIRLLYKDNDILYISIHSLHRIARYSGKDGTAPSLNKLGTSSWSVLKQKTKKKVKDIAKELIALYAKRKIQKGFAFTPDTYLQTELEASFIYEDTPDQVKSTADVKADMEKPHPMDRLICGDVGFGKTEIAIRAAFKAVCDGKQVGVLVPTTILALQHYRTFSERLKDFPVTIDYINRFKSSAQQKETLIKLKEKKIDILIGTHRLLSKDVKFDDIGLLVIDEEQKFGVGAKEKLKELRVSVDTLTLTATPIPRTLQFSLMGARDLSIINTPPPNRFPVTTELHMHTDKVIKDAVMFEVSRGGQVFVVHNKISDIHDLAEKIERLCPNVRVAVGHGQMEGDLLEEVLLGFIEGDTDVLVSTTIIESGLDISNANTMIINQAQNFGLSDLHQMRGRVGRSNKKAFCYLLTPPLTTLTGEARQRLKAIEEFSDLGSGFNVAMRDLDIRGAGNMLGGEQSGFIADIGFETFHKILDEAIFELKHTDFKDEFKEEYAKEEFVRDCQIDTDLEILLPQDYVTSITERLNLYKELDDITEEQKLEEFATMLHDRFGPVPRPAIELMDTIRLRWKAKALGFEKIFLKNNLFKGYFVNDDKFFQSPLFSGMIGFVNSHAHQCKLKDDKGKPSLVVNNIGSIDSANKILQKMLNTSNALAN